MEKNIKSLTVTMETMDSIQVENLQKAAEFLGLSEDQFSLWIMKRAFIIMCLPRRWKPGTEAWGGTASARIRLFFGSLL